MTALLEWQAKRLLAVAGIRIPDGGIASDARAAREVAERVGFPCAVKGQVRRGDRAGLGLIARADDVGELAKAVDKMLSSEAQGQVVTSVLIESWLPIEDEVYVAVTSDLRRRVSVLLLSAAGGTGIEGRHAALHSFDLPVDVRVEEHVVRNLVRTLLGRTGAETMGLVDAVRAMLDVYRAHDCWLVEVNPLALVGGTWVALDAKVRVDGDAVLAAKSDATDRLSDVLYADREATWRELAAIDIDRHDHRGSVHYVELDPGGADARSQGQRSVALHCVGTGASLTLMDELYTLGIAPVNFCDTSGSPSEEKVYEITRIVLEQDGIEAYIFLSSLATQELRTTAAGIIRALTDVRAANDGSLPFPVLIVLRGNQDEEALSDLRNAGVLDDADRSLMGRDATERSAAARLMELIVAAESEGIDGDR